ncbi:MAG: hypothetical protein ACJ8AT_32205 [Hyalangium sp.]|uniref:hypothetical protein n=1 Tax=Hyalangium sp. TaxID=2028555 RepID=UPI00389A37AF
MDASSILPNFSLVKGGPLFRAERWLHLVSPRRSSVGWRTLAFALLAWLPLLVLTLPRGGTALRSLLAELQVHAQMLLALPVFIAAEPYVDGRITLAARQFLVSHLVGVGSRPAFERSARTAMRWRDSSLAEACLLVGAFALSLVSGLDSHLEWAVTGANGSPSPAGWWYLTVSQPLFRFLALRWLFRGVLWAYFLFRVSRLPLALMPSHPDVTGGLGFLPICQSGFAPVVFALSVVVSAYTWDTQPRGLASGPLPYILPLVVQGAIAAVAVFAPLGFFTPQLVKAKRRGDSAFSALAAWHSRHFERKWFHEHPGDELLGAPDFSSLIDLGSSFTVARKMRLFPWDSRSLLGFAAASLAPLVILLMMDRKFLAVLKQVHGWLF